MFTDPAAEEGARICSVPYDRSTEVWTAWDLGIGDATTIWFAQQVGREVADDHGGAAEFERDRRQQCKL